MTFDFQIQCSYSQMVRGESKQMRNILQLEGGSKPRVLGWRFQGLLAREVGLWGVRPRRGLRGPSAMEGEGHFCRLLLFFSTVRCGAVANCRTKGQSRPQVTGPLPLAEATLSPFLVLPEMMRDPYLDL